MTVYNIVEVLWVISAIGLTVLYYYIVPKEMVLVRSADKHNYLVVLKARKLH